MADAAPALQASLSAGLRHSAVVRVTHWIATLCILALLVTGVNIVFSHPLFYWGEEGNLLTEPLFRLPIPASRGAVKTGYSFVLRDQNGWSRYLHFQAGWLLLFTGLVYAGHSFLSRHFRDNLFPARADLSWGALSRTVRDHLRLARSGGADALSYNVLQRLTYLVVIFVLVPLMFWTGLAMSPAVTGRFPAVVEVLGGFESARTIHFLVTLALALFVVVHIGMICVVGFGGCVASMITGRAYGPRKEEL